MSAHNISGPVSHNHINFQNVQETSLNPLSATKAEYEKFKFMLSFMDPYATNNSFKARSIIVVYTKEGRKIVYHRDTENAIWRLKMIERHFKELYQNIEELSLKGQTEHEKEELNELKTNIQEELKLANRYLERNQEILEVHNSFSYTTL